MSALKIKKGASSHSAYDLRTPFGDTVEQHTLAVVVENEPGVLARVIGLFSGRGYNIESLTVAETDHTGHRSRITVVTTGTPMVLEQIKALAKVVDKKTYTVFLGKPAPEKLANFPEVSGPVHWCSVQQAAPPSWP